MQSISLFTDNLYGHRAVNSLLQAGRLFFTEVEKQLTSLYRVLSSYHKTEEEIRAEYQVLMKAQQDPRHFAPLYEKYYDAIFIYINRRVDDEEVSAEITAQVFFNCLKNIRNFQFRGVPISAWLYKIALNEVNQFFKKQNGHQRAVSLKERHIDILFEEIESFEPQVDKQQLLSSLLGKLGDDDIQLLELRFFEDRSFKEIGYLLGLTEVNAKIKTYRVLDKLKKYSKEFNWQD